MSIKYVPKPPKNTGSYDEAGLTNPNGLTTKARANASTTNAGGKTAVITGENKVGGKLGRGGVKFKYPLHNEDLHPAKMKFSLHKVNAYTVDPKAMRAIWKSPFLAVGGKDTVETENDKALAGKTAALSSYDEAGLTNPKIDPTRTAVVGGTNSAPTNGTSTDRINSKDAEASYDAAAGATNFSNIKTQRVPNSPAVELYFPQSLTFNDDVNYNQVDLGPAGLGATAALNGGQNLLRTIRNGMTEGVEQIFGLVSGSISAQAAQVAAARATQIVPREGVRAAITSATQTSINPGTRLLFDKPNIRQFSFTFKLIATSAAEASQIESIVNVFRTEMYPATLDIATGVPAGYKFPNLFKIEFDLGGREMKVPSILFSYLRSAQTSYNATTLTFHEDGQPTEIDLTLIFQEYRALSRQDIEGGF